MSTPPPFRSGFLDEENLAACNDLYEITMAAAYFVNDRNPETTFELFVRRLPRSRSYLVAAGLEQALHYLTRFRFSEATIRYLREQPVFAHVPDAFFDFLSGLRFTGDVDAVREGEVFFAEEPILRVTAPVIQAQLVETYLLATLNFQTLVASKAARVVRAARGRPVADFGTRRAHGPQAGVLAARASYIGGCASTSNVLAGREFGIPIVGTAAHSFTMLFPSEMESFTSYHRVFPDNTTLLIDTYDTLDGARHAARIGDRLKGVRLDSGDLLALSRQVRGILDEAGLTQTRIVVSGDLNEYKIDELVTSGAPVDVFGVGTEMVTSRDDPALSGVYKLVEVERDGRRVPTVKLSPDKATWPNAKQVFRRTGGDGRFSGDTVALAEETADGEPLLVPVIRKGEAVVDPPDLKHTREYALDRVGRLPDDLLDVHRVADYPVAHSPRLCEARDAALDEARTRNGSPCPHLEMGPGSNEP